MSNNESSALRRIVWTDVFPWLILVRGFRIAMQLRQLFLGAFGVFVMTTGWSLVGWLFSWIDPESPVFAAASSRNVVVESSGFLSPAYAMLDPFLRVFAGPAVGFHSAAGALICGVWAIVVWSWFGAAICRSAALQLATHQSDHLGSTMRFVRRKWQSFAMAPLVPLSGILALSVPVAIVGIFLRWEWTSLLAAGLWPLLLVCGLVMALLGLVLMFAWPLMWANVATEGSDCFEAIARSYDYTIHRPLHYLFYACVASGLGFLGWLVVSAVVWGVINATLWAAGWGCGFESLRTMVAPSKELLEEFGWAGQGSVWLIHFWHRTVASCGQRIPLRVLLDQ